MNLVVAHFGTWVIARVACAPRQLMILGGKAAIDEARGSTHMGRGRAKAKQTKVARDLKYRSVNMDLESLERELRGDNRQQEDPHDEDGLSDEYADLAEKYAHYGEDD